MEFLLHFILRAQLREMEQRRRNQTRIKRDLSNSDLRLADEQEAQAALKVCHEWILANGLSVPDSAKFLDAVVRWTGDGYIAAIRAEATNPLGAEVSNLFVFAMSPSYKLIYADSLDYTP